MNDKDKEKAQNADLDRHFDLNQRPIQGKFQMSQHEMKEAQYKAMLIDRKITLKTEIKHMRSLIDQKHGPGVIPQAT